MITFFLVLFVVLVDTMNENDSFRAEHFREMQKRTNQMEELRLDGRRISLGSWCHSS